MTFRAVDRLLFAGLYLGTWYFGCLENPQTGDGDPLAPRWVPSLLALEITAVRRSTEDTRRDPPSHSGDERREPTLGSAADPRRAAQARHRYRADHRGKVYGEEKTATFARLADLSS